VLLKEVRREGAIEGEEVPWYIMPVELSFEVKASNDGEPPLANDASVGVVTVT